MQNETQAALVSFSHMVSLMPKNFVEYCVVGVLVALCDKETHCDVYITCQTSHDVSLLNNPQKIFR